MNCPKCTRRKARVIDSRPINRGRERRRRYRCRGCGHRFTGVERFAEASHIEKDIARVKGLFVDIHELLKRAGL